jgi:hypothetical protein
MPEGEYSRERRRYDRLALKLPGRYMLSDGQEFVCQIIDVSPAGIAIRGPLVGDMGERVVVYVQELGRVEGVVVRRSDDWFAVELRIPSARLHKLVTRIDGLAKRKSEGAPERRAAERYDFDHARATLQLADGTEFPAVLMDVSIEGAALEIDVTPPVGAAVRVGERRAHVSRHFAGGIAVTFDEEAGGETLDEVETGGARGTRG